MHDYVGAALTKGIIALAWLPFRIITLVLWLMARAELAIV